MNIGALKITAERGAGHQMSSALALTTGNRAADGVFAQQMTQQ